MNDNKSFNANINEIRFDVQPFISTMEIVFTVKEVTINGVLFGPLFFTIRETGCMLSMRKRYDEMAKHMKEGNLIKVGINE